MRRWKSGDQIILREVYDGKVWTEMPVTVVRDEQDLLALYTPGGTVRKRPADGEGRYLRLPDVEWNLVDEVCMRDSLRLVKPGAYYSVLLLWTAGQREFLGWYINMENPLRRTPVGFDYLDQVLDIVVSPDRQKWYWKDEDELLEAQACGLISEQKAEMLRREGERAIESVRFGLPPFNGDWENWRPHRDWSGPRTREQAVSEEEWR